MVGFPKRGDVVVAFVGVAAVVVDQCVDRRDPVDFLLGAFCTYFECFRGRHDNERLSEIDFGIC